MKATYPKLPVKFKDKWLKALRSGKYEQGSGKLCKNGKYCCVGVAGKIQGLSDDTMFDKGIFSDSWDFDNPSRVERLIPNALWGSSGENKIIQALIRMNDGVCGVKKHSFKQIANWIETHL